MLTGFVERVGDPVPLVAADGSSHRGELVLAEALDAIARAAGGGSPVTIAVPAHWGPGVVGALRSALRAKPSLAPGGVPADPHPRLGGGAGGSAGGAGTAASGVVVLCDFGASGTSITLADAHAGLAIIGDTVRYPDFSGDLIDQSLLNHVSRASPTPATPTPRAPRPSGRSPGCATSAGRPRNGCRPTPRP